MRDHHPRRSTGPRNSASKRCGGRERDDPQYSGRRDLRQPINLQERSPPCAGMDQTNRRGSRHALATVQSDPINFRGKAELSTEIRRRGTGRNRARRFSNAPDAGVVMAMYNLDNPSRPFARGVAEPMAEPWPGRVYLSTKNTDPQTIRRRFLELFQRTSTKPSLKNKFQKPRLNL